MEYFPSQPSSLALSADPALSVSLSAPGATTPFGPFSRDVPVFVQYLNSVDREVIQSVLNQLLEKDHPKVRAVLSDIVDRAYADGYATAVSEK